VTEARWPLSPRAARVFYGVADAWLPGDEADPAIDLVALLAPQLRNTRERRRLERTLWLLEWSPRLLLHSRRGLCWMDRRARIAWLERLERSRIRALGRSLASLRALIAVSADAAAGSAASQSLPGA
jgi:hypothetical protein